MELFHPQDDPSLSMFSLRATRLCDAAPVWCVAGDRGVLAVTGADSLTWLQGLLTNDVLALPIGGVCDAAYLTPQGRMITDLRVSISRTARCSMCPAAWPNRCAAAGRPAVFRGRADRRRIAAIGHRRCSRSRCAANHRRAFNADERNGTVVRPTHLACPDSACSSRARTRRRSLRSLSTVVQSKRRSKRSTWFASKRAARLSWSTWTITPSRSRRDIEDRAISFTKGCYVGQEVIVRVMHRGQGRVAKRLVGLRLAKGQLPQRGDVIATTDRDVGRITSAVWSPSLGTGIALGYVHRDFASAGSGLIVRLQNGELTQAEVAVLPFVQDGALQADR